uniref:Hemimethylated DNA-binding domain-containing protein n=1 Tax=Chromera velia CCMP2878 TaxID=1169474 RepID=A0A0G4HP50_9ALVE|eukprot:Cvel_7785.t1-p1 / transcript=Cvel_7785.t1 / gene=Cvel_7785 / organism=Chromera_velia_CCMP2878 / gene_product=F-box only protein 21, putative / transcript_product=F-box only protein 21, putative / location=Cvel_scaffold415:6278-14410(-) / protein_length=1786 / sequence_SO=supercontig / SO=protein_coding / is_pseudo=false
MTKQVLGYLLSACLLVCPHVSAFQFVHQSRHGALRPSSRSSPPTHADATALHETLSDGPQVSEVQKRVGSQLPVTLRRTFKVTLPTATLPDQHQKDLTKAIPGDCFLLPSEALLSSSLSHETEASSFVAVSVQGGEGQGLVCGVARTETEEGESNVVLFVIARFTSAASSGPFLEVEILEDSSLSDPFEDLQLRAAEKKAAGAFRRLRNAVLSLKAADGLSKEAMKLASMEKEKKGEDEKETGEQEGGDEGAFPAPSSSLALRDSLFSFFLVSSYLEAERGRRGGPEFSGRRVPSSSFGTRLAEDAETSALGGEGVGVEAGSPSDLVATFRSLRKKLFDLSHKQRKEREGEVKEIEQLQSPVSLPSSPPRRREEMLSFALHGAASSLESELSFALRSVSDSEGEHSEDSSAAVLSPPLEERSTVRRLHTAAERLESLARRLNDADRRHREKMVALLVETVNRRPHLCADLVSLVQRDRATFGCGGDEGKREAVSIGGEREEGEGPSTMDALRKYAWRDEDLDKEYAAHRIAKILVQPLAEERVRDASSLFDALVAVSLLREPLMGHLSEQVAGLEDEVLGPLKEPETETEEGETADKRALLAVARRRARRGMGPEGSLFCLEALDHSVDFLLSGGGVNGVGREALEDSLEEQAERQARRSRLVEGGDFLLSIRKLLTPSAESSSSASDSEEAEQIIVEDEGEAFAGEENEEGEERESVGRGEWGSDPSSDEIKKAALQFAYDLVSPLDLSKEMHEGVAAQWTEGIALSQAESKRRLALEMVHREKKQAQSPEEMKEREETRRSSLRELLKRTEVDPEGTAGPEAVLEDARQASVLMLDQVEDDLALLTELAEAFAAAGFERETDPSLLETVENFVLGRTLRTRKGGLETLETLFSHVAEKIGVHLEPALVGASRYLLYRPLPPKKLFASEEEFQRAADLCAQLGLVWLVDPFTSFRPFRVQPSLVNDVETLPPRLAIDLFLHQVKDVAEETPIDYTFLGDMYGLMAVNWETEKAQRREEEETRMRESMDDDAGEEEEEDEDSEDENEDEEEEDGMEGGGRGWRSNCRGRRRGERGVVSEREAETDFMQEESPPRAMERMPVPYEQLTERIEYLRLRRVQILCIQGRYTEALYGLRPIARPEWIEREWIKEHYEFIMHARHRDRSARVELARQGGASAASVYRKLFGPLFRQPPSAISGSKARKPRSPMRPSRLSGYVPFYVVRSLLRQGEREKLLRLQAMLQAQRRWKEQERKLKEEEKETNGEESRREKEEKSSEKPPTSTAEETAEDAETRPVSVEEPDADAESSSAESEEKGEAGQEQKPAEEDAGLLLTIEQAKRVATKLHSALSPSPPSEVKEQKTEEETEEAKKEEEMKEMKKEDGDNYSSDSSDKANVDFPARAISYFNTLRQPPSPLGGFSRPPSLAALAPHPRRITPRSLTPDAAPVPFSAIRRALEFDTTSGLNAKERVAERMELFDLGPHLPLPSAASYTQSDALSEASQLLFPSRDGEKETGETAVDGDVVEPNKRARRRNIQPSEDAPPVYGPRSRAAKMKANQGFVAPESAPKYRVGQMFVHRNFKYRGLIAGWDTRCEQTLKWMEDRQVFDLERGGQQPFYTVLVHGDDYADNKFFYVAEDNIQVMSPEEASREIFSQPGGRFPHADLGLFFSSFNEKTGQYVPKKALQHWYPDDLLEVPEEVTQKKSEMEMAEETEGEEERPIALRPVSVKSPLWNIQQAAGKRGKGVRTLRSRRSVEAAGRASAGDVHHRGDRPPSSSSPSSAAGAAEN